MTNSRIIYEQPLNERIRTFMRLDFLYRQTLESLLTLSDYHNRNTVNSILEIQNAFTRSDIKAETLKELERLANVLENLGKNPNVDASVLNSLLDDIDIAIDRVRAAPGPIGSQLRTNELLIGVRQRNSIAGGTCSFDMPSFHFWLSQSDETKQANLREWLSHFEPVLMAAQLVLKLVRESTPASSEIAEGGFFQRSLDTTLPCHLIRVSVDKASPYYAEISGGRHRFAVRFMRLNLYERDSQAQDDIDFSLTCCSL